MTLLEEVRASARATAQHARHVSIDMGALEAVEPAGPAALDPERHYLEGDPPAVAAYLLTLDAINFGSGWFPTLRKRPGCSGYFTVAWALADRFRARGPWSNAELRALEAGELAGVLGQEARHPLMRLYAQALRDLGRFLGPRSALDLIARGGRLGRAPGHRRSPAGWPSSTTAASTSAPRSCRTTWRSRAWRSSPTSTGSRSSPTTSSRTCCAWTACCATSPCLAALIDAERLLPAGEAEREIRACALHACELIAERSGMPPRVIDVALWNRGQEPRYKAIPRHRTRSVYY